jgi:hypothetical protein
LAHSSDAISSRLSASALPVGEHTCALRRAARPENSQPEMYMTSANADSLRDSASDALDQLQRAASPTLKEGKRQAGVLLDQGGDLIDTVGSQAGETAAKLGKSLIAYTKKNPVLALVLAVGAGALLVSATKSLTSRR